MSKIRFIYLTDGMAKNKRKVPYVPHYKSLPKGFLNLVRVI